MAEYWLRMLVRSNMMLPSNKEHLTTLDAHSLHRGSDTLLWLRQNLMSVLTEREKKRKEKKEKKRKEKKRKEKKQKEITGVCQPS